MEEEANRGKRLILSQKATGQTWPQLFKANILDPLGIPQTATLYTPVVNPNFAGGLCIFYFKLSFF
jgi:CubicO group peptidase (beta-lactamase class C family)